MTDTPNPAPPGSSRVGTLRDAIDFVTATSFNDRVTVVALALGYMAVQHLGDIACHLGTLAEAVDTRNGVINVHAYNQES